MESFSLLSAVRWFRASDDAVVCLESRGKRVWGTLNVGLFEGFGEKQPS